MRDMPHASRRCLAVATLCAALIAACSSSRRTDVPAPPIDPTRLSHERHAQIPCGGCHRTSARPGADDHKPCDDGACHKKEFLGLPGLFCRVCHKGVTTSPLAAPLRPYPATDDAWQSLPPVFSHAKHLDSGRMERSVGFHVSCNDCHVDSNNARARPDHAVCARCHAAEVALAKAPRMEDCAGCHKKGAQQRTRSRLVRDDVRPFDHDRHRTDRRNQPIRCESCHERSATARGYADHGPPRIDACVGCHDDSARTPSALRMRICETCHTTRKSTLTVIAPRSHLPVSERPIDHTIAFRRDHAESAARDSVRCATCHIQMSGNALQTCDDCHQTMSPSDHRITWRELDHGPEAASDRNRCATCHVVEFCTACHAQRPRSHGLVTTFRTEHGRLARINIRACLTCHNPEARGFAGTCSQVGCHEGGP
jgi:hypothetical protein